MRQTAQAAVIREFSEELGLEIRVLGAPRVMENLFHHEGAVGHEIIFLFDIALPSGSFETLESFVFHENNGEACVANWFDLDDLDRDGAPALYPAGLKALLKGRSASA